MDYLKTFREMVSLRGLTDHTVKSYSTYISAYLSFLEKLGITPEDASWDIMRGFTVSLQKERSLSDRTINAAISQLRFFTLYVLHKPWDPYQLPLRKFDSYLPFVPTQEEVRLFLSSFTDLKQKAMLVLMYSAGLRVGEVCRLRYEDISRKKMQIHVTHGKNRSDRYAILSQTALDILTQYWFSFGRPSGYLFPKQRDPEKPIDTFYIARHMAAMEEKLGWPHRFTCHSLRHAFGTHLYENGVDILTIKELLGHKSLTSTMIYVHLAANGTKSAASPLDTMGGLL